MNIPVWLILALVASNICWGLLYFRESDLRWGLYRKLGSKEVNPQ